MSITARILTGFIVLSVAAVCLLLNPIISRVEMQYLEAAEEPMVDAAEILASMVSAQLEASGRFDDSFSKGFANADQRKFEAQIYDLRKRQVLMEVYVTDGLGVILYDSGHPKNVGRNFGQYNDVSRTLEGHYGARTTPQTSDINGNFVMYVAAPLIVHGKIAGVLSVYKPQGSLRAFIVETRRKLEFLGLCAIAASVVIGTFLSRWVSAPLVSLSNYAAAIARGERPPSPRLPGRHLKILGDSLEHMRDALEGRKYAESYVQTLSHEMKAPVAAIRGAAELLQEDMPDAQRDKFLSNIQTESVRLQKLIDQLLALSVIENRKQLEHPEPIDLSWLAARVTAEERSRAAASGVTIQLSTSGNCEIQGDEFLLETAVRNLLRNAVEFSPAGGSIQVSIRRDGRNVTLTVEDDGPGIPEYAVGRVFERFYSLPRPSTGKKSSGLGLNFVREAAVLHSGSASLENRKDRSGAAAGLVLPVEPAA